VAERERALRVAQEQLQPGTKVPREHHGPGKHVPALIRGVYYHQYRSELVH
jgi:hypothetical protein